ncbi:hypothetical protein [Larkinella soli]|uniref:hypothetical protein n=1 Tax=Larkinella soli TaxID=1770527 RepID=UPI000FFCA586|nr:hypothetical protein [Larkinella soli]
MEQKFNFNDYIKVKLTPEGFVEWKAYEDGFLSVELQKTLEVYYSEVDAEGYVLFQFWCFIKMFGHHFLAPWPNPPFELDAKLKLFDMEYYL